MFPFPSESVTFSQTDRASVIRIRGGAGEWRERELEQYFKASWPVFDPLFLRVCRDHQEQGIVLLGLTGVCIAEMLRQIRLRSISGLQEKREANSVLMTGHQEKNQSRILLTVL